MLSPFAPAGKPADEDGERPVAAEREVNMPGRPGLPICPPCEPAPAPPPCAAPPPAVGDACPPPSCILASSSSKNLIFAWAFRTSLCACWMTASFLLDAWSARMYALAPCRFLRSEVRLASSLAILGSDEAEGG